MIITILPQDLKGNYYNAHDCPLARAMKRKFPKNDVIVGGTFLEIDGKDYKIDHKNWDSDILEQLRKNPKPYNVEIFGL